MKNRPKPPPLDEARLRMKLAGARQRVRNLIVLGMNPGYPQRRGRPSERWRVGPGRAFHSFASGPVLALLTSLVADGSLKPQIGAERSWRDLYKTLDALRDRRIAGKAIFRIE
jgi:hypothetical protein